MANESTSAESIIRPILIKTVTSGNDMDIEARILQLIDAKWAVEDIAADVQASTSYVYKVLTVHRPGRKRIRRRKSELRYKISGLLQNGLAPARVAFLCKTSRQYVHRIASQLQDQPS